MLGFALDLPPLRMSFGFGESRKLPDVLDALGAVRPLLVGTPSSEDRHGALIATLDGRSAPMFFGAAPHCPVEVVERCRRRYLSEGCDSVVALGGGSTLGLGKILAAEEHAKFVAVPSTYSGSEMTALFGRKVGREKRVARDPNCRPDYIIYDPSLTRSLPGRTAAMSGMNSIAHAVEALYPRHPNPIALPLAEQALVAHRSGLPHVARGEPTDEALADALYGGFLGGWLVQMCGIALHHQLCHVIGGLFDLPHAATNSAVLPHVVAYNSPAIPEGRSVIQRVFGAEDAAAALFDFARGLGVPQKLSELGMPESGLEAVAARMLSHQGWNPRPIEREGLLRLLTDAFEGRRPRSLPP